MYNNSTRSDDSIVINAKIQVFEYSIFSIHLKCFWEKESKKVRLSEQPNILYIELKVIGHVMKIIIRLNLALNCLFLNSSSEGVVDTSSFIYTNVENTNCY